MVNRRCSRNGQQHGRSFQQPSKCHLVRGGLVRSGDLVEYLPRESARSQWEPQDEGDSIALTIIHHVIPFTIRKTIAILHGNDGDDLACPLDVLLRDISTTQQGESYHARSGGPEFLPNPRTTQQDRVYATGRRRFVP